MEDTNLTVLLVEDNVPDAQYIEELFGEIDWYGTEIGGEQFEELELHHVETLAACRDLLTRDDTEVDVVLLDLNLPDSRNVDTLDSVLDVTDDEAVVVLTGLNDERIGSEAIERGAQDYLVKDDIDATLLGRTIRYAVTRQRRERMIRRRNEELALLNRLVRHDIRDDMALIEGWGRTLEDHVDREGEQYLARMLEASTHVIDLTDTVGEFLDALQEREDVRLEPFDLESTIESELEKARSVHEEALFEVDGNLPETDVAATELLSSVFRNLFANAVQHNDEERPQISVSATVADDAVTVAVADNGPGIPDDKKDAIFGRTAAGLGDPECGVGLYLVDTLVDLYGGDIRVRDNDPEGSVFEVTLQRIGTYTGRRND